MITETRNKLAVEKRARTRSHLDDGGIARLDLLGVVLELLSRTTIDLLEQLLELARNVSGVAVDDRCVTLADLTGVVQDDDLKITIDG